MNLALDVKAVTEFARNDTSDPAFSPPSSPRFSQVPSTPRSPTNVENFSPPNSPTSTHQLLHASSFGDLTPRDETATSSSTKLDYDTSELDEMLQSGFVRRGPCGLLERLPLFLKLAIMLSISLIGMIIIGVLLIQEQASVIKNARKGKTFSNVIIYTGELIHEYQNERYLAQIILSGGGTSAVVSEYESQCLITNQKVTQFLSFVKSDSHSADVLRIQTRGNYNRILNDQTVALRENVLKNGVTYTSATTNYTSTITTLQGFVTNFVDNSVSSRIVTPFLLLSEYKEKLAAARIMLFVIAQTSSAETNYYNYVTFLASSQLLETLISRYSSERIQTGLTDAYLSPKNQQLNQIFSAIARTPNNVTVPVSTIVNLTAWKIETVYNLQQDVGSVIVSDAKKVLSGYTGRISAIIVIIFIVWVLSITSAIIISQAITGPWRRMILMQEMTINKFVPKELLRLLKCYRLSELVLGQCVERELTVVFASITNFVGVTETMGTPEKFAFVNKYLAQIGPVVRKYGGYIDKFLGDSIMICFHSANDGVYCSMEMQTAVFALNETSPTESQLNIMRLELSMGMHNGKSAVGTVGENQRMEGTILSDTVQIASRMQALARAFKAKIITPNEVVKKLKQPILFPFRPIGYVRVGGKRQYMKVYEIIDKTDTKKIDTLHDFRLAVQCMVEHNHDRALEIFDRILNRNPDDAAARIIKASCHSYKITFEHKARDVTVTDIMQNRILREMFSQFCKEERSEENFKFWLAIDGYANAKTPEERVTIAKNIYRKFLAKDARNMVNTSEQQTNAIMEAVKNSDMNNDSMEPNLFDSLRTEVEILMNDTYTRYKKSSKFIDAVKKTMPVPLVSLSDEDTM